MPLRTKSVEKLIQPPQKNSGIVQETEIEEEPTKSPISVSVEESKGFCKWESEESKRNGEGFLKPVQTEEGSGSQES